MNGVRYSYYQGNTPAYIQYYYGARIDTTEMKTQRYKNLIKG